jgi:fructose-bisphosphate aldolase class I
VKAAQQALLHRAKCNLAARRGEYIAAMETHQHEMETSNAKEIRRR